MHIQHLCIANEVRCGKGLARFLKSLVCVCRERERESKGLARFLKSLPSIATRWARKQGLVNVVETNSVYSPQCFLHRQRLVPIYPLNTYIYTHTQHCLQALNAWSYRVSMRSLRKLSADASSLDALARLLPSAACRVLLQHRRHLAVALLPHPRGPIFRDLQGSLLLLCVCMCVCVCVCVRACVCGARVYIYICIYV